MTGFSRFSPKQLRVLTWWLNENDDLDGIIADGAVRSGKTLCMTVSFLTWACRTFDSASFAICGKTIASVRRNIISPVFSLLNALGFECEEKLSQNLITVTAFGKTNKFWLFGGKDEASASLIQGMTLSGVMLDEVALMPRSFCEQAVARCSVTGAKLWFNCNPDHPMHWFYREWILKAHEKKCLYVHFEMRDNPSLSPSVIARYERLYEGAFRERFVLGRWVAAQGAVYPMFDKEIHIKPCPDSFEKYWVSCDYGTVNPSSFGLWGQSGDKWYRISEYYYDSRLNGKRRTDSEHLEALEKLTAGLEIEAVIVDPSAASFIECIQRKGCFSVIPARNDVLDGIRRVQDMLKAQKLVFSPDCRDSIREFGLYRWSEKGGGDSVVKENDHAMDDIRYFVSTVVSREADDFFVGSIKR